MPVASPYSALLASVTREHASTNVLGSTTHYWSYGDPEAETTIVMVHGFRGDHHGLEPVVAHVLGTGPGGIGARLRIVSPDLPGFGDSTPMTVSRHDIEGYAAWLAAFVAVLGLREEAVVILGHSFGSIVTAGAVAGGLQTPLLVLVNPIAAPALSGPRGILTRLAVFYYWLSAKLPEAIGFALLRSRAVVRIMSLTMTKTKEKELRAFIHDQHDRYFSAFASRSVVLEAFRASVGHDVSEYAPRIGIRTQLIAADQDDITPLAAQHLLQKSFPNAELHVISRVGHLIHYETPAEAARALCDAVEHEIGGARP